ncbi:KLTH0B00374p-like protein [Beauveria brongniartii RCEF 3172]|uniref:KLTH0B00374p-like protein n=1 Tax=Beauveria brongniartii RCEF 3172 TaxID=1081107 RepID=A0A166Z5R1_9HYPO|nr:KLTH0B00374p-like protein [Beauveria brongniartii RCEF 3172]
MMRTTAINLLDILAAAVHAQAVDSNGYIVHNGHTRIILPSSASAIDNAHHIFNQLNSAGRQWGSSLAHNGVGFFPAIVPAGTLLYHGDDTDQPPADPEWLAFDVEHAESFAVSSLRFSGTTRRAQGELTRHNQAPAQKPVLFSAPSHHPGDASQGFSHGRPAGPASVPECPPAGCRNIRGYLHTYQASRDLRVLYLDGMAAAKTTMGTLDSQDLVLCEGKIGNLTGSFPFGEDERASMICEMLADWGYDGFVRMEGGFELVYCDFSTGVSFLSARRTFYPQDRLNDEGHQTFQVFRAAAEHYDGIGAERLRIDFSSMVSGWLFPINLTNADPDRPDLPRFSSVKQHKLKAIKSQVSHAYDLF